MPAAIYVGTLSAEALDALLGKLRPQAPHAILERPDKIDFPGPDEPLSPLDWEEGRIFGDPLELRWGRRGDGFRVVLTCEEAGDGHEGLRRGENLGEPDPPNGRAYYLWGEGDTRIGRQMEYRSLPGNGRAQLVVAEFYDEAGELRHWRYLRFQRENQP